MGEKKGRRGGKGRRRGTRRRSDRANDIVDDIIIFLGGDEKRKNLKIKRIIIIIK